MFSIGDRVKYLTVWNTVLFATVVNRIMYPDGRVSYDLYIDNYRSATVWHDDLITMQKM